VAENAASRHGMDNMNPAPGAGKVIRAPSLKRGKNDETRLGDRVSVTVLSLLLSFWTLSIVRISTNRKHNVSETGSVSVFRRGGGGHLLYRTTKTCLSTGDARTEEGPTTRNKGTINT
jgi:hypothetical protein